MQALDMTKFNEDIVHNNFFCIFFNSTDKDCPSFDSYKLMNFSIIRTRGKVMNERNALLLQQRDNNHSPVHKYEPSMGKLVCMSPETTWKSCPQVPGCRKMLGYIY